MIKKILLTSINKTNLSIVEKSISLKKKIIKNNITTEKKKINFKKIKVLGNFFKLKFKKTKSLIKFNLCLAHKIYILKNKNNSTCFKKIKKNKLIYLEKNTKVISKKTTLNALNLFSLKKKKTT